MDLTRKESDSVVQGMLYRYRRFLRVEVTLLIAASLGAFTLNGYVHLESLYVTLNVPIDRMNFSPQKLAIYGGASITAVIGAAVLGMASVLGITVIAALFERPNKEPSPWIVAPRWLLRFRERASELAFSLKVAALAVILAILCLFSWYVTMSLPSETGRKAATKIASKCHERILTYRNLDRVSGCQVAESDDMFFLIKRSHVDEEGVTFRAIEVPKAGLLKSESQEQTLRYDED